jgi:TatD DNase family protein
MITFKQAHGVRDSFALTPLDRLLLETDSPYLTPAPLRGRRNEPAHVRLVLARAAELAGRTPQELERITGENLTRLFRLDRAAPEAGGG